MVAPALDDSVLDCSEGIRSGRALSVNTDPFGKTGHWATPFGLLSAFAVWFCWAPVYFSQERLLVRYYFALLLGAAVLIAAAGCNRANTARKSTKRFAQPFRRTRKVFFPSGSIS